MSAEKKKSAPLASSPEAEASRREHRMEEIRRRLRDGELDSDLALVETAHALLDGDRPGLAPLRRR